MRSRIEKMVAEMLRRAEAEVPESGAFTPVREVLDLTNDKIYLSMVKLIVCKPALLEGPEYETRRYLELDAYNWPECPYVAERVLKAGTKQEIIEKLREPDLVEEIEKKIRQLEDDLAFL